MTPDTLRNWILGLDPTDTVRIAFDASKDAECAELCNIKDQPGYVPARELSAIMARRNLWGLVMLATRFRKLPNDADCPIELFTLFVTCELAAYSTMTPPLMFEVGPLTAALTALRQYGMIDASDDESTPDTDEILAAEVKVSRIENDFGYGKEVTEQLVGRARNEVA